jgi:mannitol/fructose-specific phosphotransferase system IIA component (Ntr-type)
MKDEQEGTPKPQAGSPPPRPPRGPNVRAGLGDDAEPGPEPEVVELRAEDRWEAIDELIDHLVATRKIKTEDREAIAADVKKRESSMSTAVGFGIGLPHASTDLVSDLIVVMGRSAKGIHFDALDGKPVKRVALFLVPQGQFHKHAPALANLAKMLHKGGGW